MKFGIGAMGADPAPLPQWFGLACLMSLPASCYNFSGFLSDAL